MTTAVYLVQPNYESVSGQWLPYSVGLLWSYAIQDPEINANYHLERMIYKREDIDKFAKSAVNGAVYAFSCYLWNWEYNKTLAQKIKENAPESLIIFGGPQISNRPLETNFFKQHPYVDSIILVEGEISFTTCLKNKLIGKHQKIYQSVRLTDLNIPSPYLIGLFDQLILDNPGVLWHATLETNRGCPYQCTFCDWGSLIYSKIKKFDEDRVYQEIEWMGKVGIDYILIADANFGIFKDRDYKIADKLCEIKRKYNSPNNLAINFAKNSNTHVVDIVKLFSDSKLSRGVTISFQSLSETVLRDIKRDNMDINNAGEIFKLLDQKQLNYYSELLIGLPSETLESWKQGLFKLIDIGQHQCIDIFFVMLLENSELNLPDYKNKFGIQSVKIGNFMSHYVPDYDVAEQAHIICATNTMSTDDIINGTMFSWMIINFHCYGWTQIYSRFFNATTTATVEEFYSNLLTHITANKMGIISDLYQEYKDMTELYINNNAEFVRLGHNQFIMQSVQEYFHTNKNEIESLITEFIVANYWESAFAELIEYQKHFVASKDCKYPYTVDLDFGIYRTIAFAEQYTIDVQPCVLTVTGEFVNEQDFLSKLTLWRRNGWGKTMIGKKEANGNM